VTWLGLTRFTRLTQRSQGQKAKPAYLKELLDLVHGFYSSGRG